MRASILCITFLSAMAVGLVPGAEEVYRITDRVLVRDPPRFGVNLDVSGPEPWYPDRWINEWNLMAACEPATYQYNGTCDGGGEDFLQHREGARLSWWDCARSGFWDGAQVRVYRMGPQGLGLLRSGTVARSVCGDGPDGKRTDERLYFTEPGPAVRAGDLYIVVMSGRLSPAKPVREALISAQGIAYDTIVLPFQGATWALDGTTFCPEGSSSASMRLTLPAGDPGKDGGRSGIWQWWIIKGGDNLFFCPGKSYRCQVWLKQQGLASQQVTIKLGTVVTRTVEVGDAWKKYEFDVPVDQPKQPYQSSQGEDTQLRITATGPGTLWIDNLLVWQADVPQFAMLPDYRDALQEWKPGMLRVWAGATAHSAKDALSCDFARNSRGGYARINAPQGMPIPTALRACLQVGAKPWIIINPLWSEEDNRFLMEYLAGPVSTPGGAWRKTQGQEQPWAEAFGAIYLESSNEAWNQIFCPLAWPGKPELYAAIADHQFRELKASPHYRADRFQFILNGWDGGMDANGWTRQVASASCEGQIIDAAIYFGGWEKAAAAAGGGGEDEAKAILQDKLFTTQTEFGRKWLLAQGVDPALPRRLAAALGDDAALRTAVAAQLAPSNRWADDALPAFTGEDVRGSLRVLMAADKGLGGSIRELAGSLRDPLESTLWLAIRRALTEDPAFSAQTAADLGIDADAVRAFSGPLMARFHLESYAGYGKKFPKAVMAMADSAALKLGAKEQAEMRALADGKIPGYGLPNAFGVYIRARTAALIAKDPVGFACTIRRFYDDALIRLDADSVRWTIRDRCNSLGARNADQLVAVLHRDPASAGAFLLAMGRDASLFGEQALALQRLLAEAIPALATPAKTSEWTFSVLNALPVESRRLLLEPLLAGIRAPGSGYQPAEVMLVGAAAAAICGDGAPAAALVADRDLTAQICSRIVGNIQQAILKSAQEDASLGERLIGALAMQASTGKRLAVYEGGPGYVLPAPGVKPPENDENVGKSLALGTATLDAYLQATIAGKGGPMCYYNLKSGPYWAFQNNIRDRIPYPSWIALGMRNRWCSGDLVQVDRITTQAVDIADREVIRTTNDGKGSKQTIKGRRGVPITGCYAFQDGDRMAIVLINRDVSEPHDFRLQLPAMPAGPAQVHLLTAASPAAHNRTAAMVREQDAPAADLGGPAPIRLPAASCAVVVVRMRGR